MGAKKERSGNKRTAGNTAVRTQSKILIVSGLSGSGKTVALRAVEDAGYYCADNIPASLISLLIDKITGRGSSHHIAIGIDIREKEFLSDISATVAMLRKKFHIEILYLEAEADVLIRRYKETRRPHPLGGRLEDAIMAEKKALSELKAAADRVINTSTTSPHELRRLISSLYSPQKARKALSVHVISFGFKYGIPQNVDLLFDARFLPNPHFVPELREFTGGDKKVADFVFSHKVTSEFMKKIKDLLTFLIPHYIKEGKSYLSIAIGCTGGRHRSPAIAEKIAGFISGSDLNLQVIHRDL